MTTNVQSRAPLTKVNFAIVLDADWRDMLPSVEDGDGPIDMSINERKYQMYIRPQYDNSILIAYYETVETYGATGIFVDPDDESQIPSIFVPRSEVGSTFVVGTYDVFLVLEEKENSEPDAQTLYSEIWRGKFAVHAGNVESY